MSKTFHDGEILTAADVNNYLLNDDSQVETVAGQINALAEQCVDRLNSLSMINVPFILTYVSSPYLDIMTIPLDESGRRILRFPNYLKLVFFGSDSNGFTIISDHEIQFTKKARFCAVLITR